MAIGTQFRQPDAGLPVVVAVVQHQPAAAGVDDAGVFDHVVVPAGRRDVDAGAIVHARPHDAVARFRIADAVAIAAVRVPHAVHAGIANDAGTGDRVLVIGLEVDADHAAAIPRET